MKKRGVIFVFSMAVLSAIISCVTNKTTSSAIEIPFTLEHGQIVVEATINGKTAKYAWSIVSNISVLKDIDPDWPLFFEPDKYQESAGAKRHYRIEELLIGGVPIRVNQNSLAMESDPYDDPYGLNGSFGIDVFGGYWCEVSFSKNKIILHSQKPSYFTQSIKGTFDSKKMLTVPVNIEGRDYDFLFESGDYFDTVSLPISYIRRKSKDEYKRYLSSNRYWGDIEEAYLGEPGETYWVKTENISVFDDTLRDKVIMASPFVAEFIWYDYGKDIGSLSWGLLQNYDLLFDFTGIDYINTIDENFSLETRIYYAPLDRSGKLENLFLTEYPGGELGAFVFIEPAGITLYLAEDSPLLTLGITANTVITRINGTLVGNMAEAGMTPFSYQTVLTILDENKGEREIALEQLRP
jgi:hypothetical protein